MDKIIAASAVVSDAAYRLESENGLAVGTALVEIRPRPLDREFVEAAFDKVATSLSHRPRPTNVVENPEKFGSKSKIKVGIMASDGNRYDFKLSSRA